MELPETRVAPDNGRPGRWGRPGPRGGRVEGPLGTAVLCPCLRGGDRIGLLGGVRGGGRRWRCRSTPSGRVQPEAGPGNTGPRRRQQPPVRGTPGGRRDAWVGHGEAAAAWVECAELGLRKRERERERVTAIRKVMDAESALPGEEERTGVPSPASTGAEDRAPQRGPRFPHLPRPHHRRIPVAGRSCSRSPAPHLRPERRRRPRFSVGNRLPAFTRSRATAAVVACQTVSSSSSVSVR